MPTLRTIQGASLAPRVDAIELLRQGTAAGREIDQTRRAGDMDRILQQAAQQQPVTGGAVTPGAPGGTVPVASPAGVPGASPASGAGMPQGGGGTVMDVLTSPELQRQLVAAGGVAGYNNAVQLNNMAHTLYQRRLEAQKQELENVASVSLGLLDLDKGGQDQAIAQILATSGDDPNVLRTMDQLRRLPTKDARDIALRRMLDRALPLQEAINMRLNEAQTAINAMNARASQLNAQTAAERVPIEQQRANIDAAQLAFDQATYESSGEKERAKQIEQSASEMAAQDRQKISAGRETISVLDRTLQTLDELEKTEGGTVAFGANEFAGRIADFLDPELGDRFREQFQAGEAVPVSRLRLLLAQNLQAAIAGLENKANFSDSDREALRAAQASMDANSSKSMRAQINTQKQTLQGAISRAAAGVQIYDDPERGSQEYFRYKTQSDMSEVNASNKRQFPGAPDIGAVEDGMRYMGGNPGSPTSWAAQ